MTSNIKKAVSRMLFDAEIYGEITYLDDGISALIVGGNKSHIGSVSIAESSDNINTISFSGHKDEIIGERWARALVGKYKCRVVVECGIHYDHASHDEIASIVSTTDEMLSELLMH